MAKINFSKISKSFNKTTKNIDKKRSIKPFATEELKKLKASLSLKHSTLSKDEFLFQVTEEEQHTPNYIKPVKKYFSSYISAQNYAKNRVVKALNANNPYEHLVLIDKKTNTIIGEYKGDERQVSEDVIGYLKSTTNTSHIHGHPTMFIKEGTPITSPVSWPDFVSINQKGDEIFAYNINGEYSVLRKNQNFQTLSDEQINYYDKKYLEFMDRRFIKKKKSQFPKEFNGIETLEDFEKRCSELSHSIKKHSVKKQIDKELKKLLDEFNSSFDVVEAVHDFWIKYADELGLTYKTNYSYLK